MEYACEAGITPNEFWQLTWKELEMLCNGYERRMARGKEIQRMLLGAFLNVHRRRGAGPVNIEKIVPLVTDQKKKKPELLTLGEYEKLKNLKVEWQSKN